MIKAYLKMPESMQLAGTGIPEDHRSINYNARSLLE
jgi:hypothetical protein